MRLGLLHRAVERRALLRLSIGSSAKNPFLRASPRSPSLLQGRAFSSSREQAPDISEFPGAPGVPFTTTLKMRWPTEEEKLPCYRVLNDEGGFVDEGYESPFTDEELLHVMDQMVALQAADSVFYDAQRQGRIPFYMTNIGEEACHIGSAAAWNKDDHIFSQYREAGVLLWRGWSVQDMANQCISNKYDQGKGRQMAVHYGDRNINLYTISSPLATQLPQAAGVGYALKREGKDAVVVCYFGDGSASEGDCHPAMNMAATLKCPVVFFCRNNGYAISTPVHEQYRGDGVGARGPPLGIPTLRVDGNDFFAVFEASKKARSLAVENHKAVMIEAMAYRIGHHSTSDDSSRYRDLDEVMFWMNNRSGIERFKRYMFKRGIWDEERHSALEKSKRKEVLQALVRAEGEKKPSAEHLWADVYDNSALPPHLQEQKEGLDQHFEEWGEKYHLEEFEPLDSYQIPPGGERGFTMDLASKVGQKQSD